jgi:hypothetical protein
LHLKAGANENCLKYGVSVVLMAGLRDHEKMAVVKKSYDLILRSCNHTSTCSPNQLFVLDKRKERSLHDLRRIAGLARKG